VWSSQETETNEREEEQQSEEDRRDEEDEFPEVSCLLGSPYTLQLCESGTCELSRSFWVVLRRRWRTHFAHWR
jgi:hypothetical protein